MAESIANYLVISDLHLGEDIGHELAREHLARVERDLVAFLEHHAAHRLDDRPWHLVVNGDMVDFLAVCLMPAETGQLLGHHPDEHLYGLGGSPRAARAKMRAVLSRHERFFAALARFVGVGNALSIVIGNHDAELYWPEVQQTLREALMGLWARDPLVHTEGARRPEEVGDVVAFHPWFFFVEDLFWIEHGHQYDGYCSFDAILNPVTPDGTEIDLNISSAGIRYVTNHYSPNYEHLDFWHYWVWAFREKRAQLASLGAAFFMANLRLFRLWWSLTPEVLRARRKTHLERLGQLASISRLPEKVLLELDDLRQRPMVLELGRILRGFMVDRLLVALCGTLVLSTLLLAAPWGWFPVAAALVIGAMFWLDRRLSLDRPSIYPQENMRRVALAIRKLVRAPIVVFGHSHDAGIERHDDGGWYVNTGTWFVERKSDLVKTFTHLRIRVTKDGPRPELCRWSKGKSLAYEPLG